MPVGNVRSLWAGLLFAGFGLSGLIAGTASAVAGEAAAAGGSKATQVADADWQRITLDKAFRSEGVAVADVNHDGKQDVLVGDYWYAAPDWTKHEIRKPGEFVAGKGYSNCFAVWSYDVNGDGWDDQLVVGFPGAPCHWYENPQNKDGHWQEHVIWHSACNESPDFEDVDGDGRPELLMGSQPEKQMGYLPMTPASAKGLKWDFRAISEPGEPHSNGTFKYYHGLGVGDVNKDGRNDVIIPHGWWEQPADKTTGDAWTFHKTQVLRDGKPVVDKAADIYVDDLDLDGDQDMLLSSAHAYGVWWLENTAGKAADKFVAHTIDTSYSQTHAAAYVDMNGDGKRDLVTGKRYFAHNGNDPGGKDPVNMYWYEMHPQKGGPKIIRHEITAGLGTGVGTQFTVADMNGDKRPDIVLSNKSGVNILLQK